MADALRIRRVKYNVRIGRALGKVRRMQIAALRELAAEMTTTIAEKLDVQGPPRSSPGEPPHRDTGNLQATTEVVFDGANRLYVRTPQYGIYLDGGTSRMEPRPFLRSTIHDQRDMWQQRYRELMRRFRSGG